MADPSRAAKRRPSAGPPKPKGLLPAVNEDGTQNDTRALSGSLSNIPLFDADPHTHLGVPDQQKPGRVTSSYIQTGEVAVEAPAKPTSQPTSRSTSPSRSSPTPRTGGILRRISRGVIGNQLQNDEDMMDDNTPDEKLLAITLVEDALVGKESVPSDDPDIVRSYRVYHNKWLVLVLWVIVMFHLSLVCFEHPNGTLDSKLAPTVAVPLELVCLFIFACRVYHHRQLRSMAEFWKDRKNVVLIGVITIMSIDAIVFLILHETGNNTFRWSRVLRPLIYVNFSDFRQVRRGFRSMRKTLMGVLNVVILLLMHIGLFSLLFVKLFENKGLVDKSGKAYFSNFLDAYFDLYVLMTSANYPDVMMPAYDTNRGYVIPFAIFIISSMYVFLSVVLAVVYDNYRNHMKWEIKGLIKMRRHNLRRAFNILSKGTGFVSFHKWKMLVTGIFPSYSRGRILLLWRVLDEHDNGQVNAENFSSAADVLNVNLTMVTSGRNFFNKYAPGMYNSKASSAVIHAVKHWGFGQAFNVIIVANTLLILLKVDEAEPFFLTVFTIEILLKMYAYGFRNFFRTGWNVFDLCVIAGCLAVMLLEAMTVFDKDNEQQLLDLLLILRVLRLVKVLGSMQRFRTLINTIWAIKSAILTYGTMVAIIYYMFAIIGMDLFAGKITEGNHSLIGSTFLEGSPYFIDIHANNPILEGSEFAADGYYANNFNDPVSAFVVLFELTVVNQWHVLTDGFVLLTSKWARIYFVLFHLITVVLTMNILIAFIIEAFLLQLEYDASPLEDIVDEKIRSELEKSPSLQAEFGRLRIEKRAQHFSVFLQRMFEGEIIDELKAEAKDKAKDRLAAAAELPADSVA